MSYEKPETNSQEPDDQALGRVVRGAVAEGLEHQRGRALSAFRARSQKPEARSQKVLKLWAGAASAMAACLAVVVTSQFLMGPPSGNHGKDNSTVANSSEAVVDQVTYTRNVDGGMVMLDDQTPARMVRQQTVKRTQWFDPREKAMYRVTEPVEKVGYVKVLPY